MLVLLLLFLTSAAAQQPSEIRAVLVPAGPPMEEVPSDLFFQSGHQGRVTALAFSPPGPLLASAGDDRTVRLWDAPRGIQRFRLPHASPVRTLAFSPDGAQLASGSAGGVVAVWDAATGRLLRQISGPPEAVVALAFSPEGARIAAGGAETGAVRLHDIDTGQQIAAMEGELPGLTTLVFTPQGLLGAGAVGDMEMRGTVKVWDPSTGRLLDQTRELLRAAVPGGSPRAIQEGQWATQTVRIEPGGLAFKGNIGPVAFSPGGEWVAYSAHPGAAVTVAAAGGGPSATLAGRDWEFETLAVSADGALAATAGNSGEIAVWEVAAARRLHQLAPRQSLALVFSPDGRLLTTGAETWDLASRAAVPSPPMPDGVLGVAFSPDGRFLAAGARALQLLDRRTNRLLREFRGPTDVLFAPVFSPDGALLAANCRGIAMVWDARTGAERHRFGSHDLMDTGTLAFTPDGRSLVAGGPGRLRIYDLSANRLARELPLSGNTAALAFSPDGRILAAGSRAQLRLRRDRGAAGPPFEPVPGQGAAMAAWDLASGSRLFLMPAGDAVSALAFTPGGLLAVSGPLERPGSARLLDAHSGRAIRTVVEKVDAQSSAAISPDGLWLAGVARAGGVKLWKLR